MFKVPGMNRVKNVGTKIFGASLVRGGFGVDATTKAFGYTMSEKDFVANVMREHQILKEKFAIKRDLEAIGKAGSKIAEKVDEHFTKIETNIKPLHNLFKEVAENEYKMGKSQEEAVSIALDSISPLIKQAVKRAEVEIPISGITQMSKKATISV